MRSHSKFCTLDLVNRVFFSVDGAKLSRNLCVLVLHGQIINGTGLETTRRKWPSSDVWDRPLSTRDFIQQYKLMGMSSVDSGVITRWVRGFRKSLRAGSVQYS